MAALERTPEASAIQISAVPACVFTRLTSFQPSAAPATLSDCVVVLGPSEAAKATRTSFANTVVMRAVRVSLPFDDTTTSTPTPAGGGGGGGGDGADTVTVVRAMTDPAALV